MNPWTCADVEAHLELYAAGEGDPATRAAVERHLVDCPACAAELAETRKLLDLLDLRLQEPDRLARLQTRFQATALRPTRSRLLPLLQRYGALAAMLLFILGFTGWLGSMLPTTSREAPPDLALSWNISAGRAPAVPIELVKDGGPENATAKVVALFREQLDRKGRSADEYRLELETAAQKNRLPLPPRLDLTLEIKNRGREPIVLLLGDEGNALDLDLAGPGVVRFPVPIALPPAILAGPEVELAPGQTHDLPIQQLIDGSPSQLRYSYWTEPGEYTLKVRLRLLVMKSGKREPVSLMGPTARIRVE